MVAETRRCCNRSFVFPKQQAGLAAVGAAAVFAMLFSSIVARLVVASHDHQVVFVARNCANVEQSAKAKGLKEDMIAKLHALSGAEVAEEAYCDEELSKNDDFLDRVIVRLARKYS